MTLRVVVLEDEPPALARMERALRAARPDLVVAARLDTVAGAREWFLREAAPDLVVSDIRLADGLAFELFAEGIVSAPVVFATAHDDYLLQAFRFAVIDYLLKPISDAAVASALEKLSRLREVLTKEDAAALLTAARSPRRRLLVRKGSDLVALSVDGMAYARAEQKLTVVVAHDGTEHVTDKTLRELEAELDPRDFFRANRALLVGASAIRSFRSAGKGRISLELAPRPPDDAIVPQENAASFRSWIDR